MPRNPAAAGRRSPDLGRPSPAQYRWPKRLRALLVGNVSGLPCRQSFVAHCYRELSELLLEVMQLRRVPCTVRQLRRLSRLAAPLTACLFAPILEALVQVRGALDVGPW